MKALTVYQPWASLIAIEAKPYEFRGWPAPRRVQGVRIAIHASARPIKLPEIDMLIEKLTGPDAWEVCLRAEVALPLLIRVRDNPELLPRSAIVCTAILGQPLDGFDIVHEFGGRVNDSERDDHANWAWPVRHIERLTPPVEARGAQGFWNWNRSP